MPFPKIKKKPAPKPLTRSRSAFINEPRRPGAASRPRAKSRTTFLKKTEEDAKK